MIDGLRWFFVAVWAVLLLALFPSTIRLAFRRARGLDRIRTANWFLAVVLVGFALRWILFPHPELVMTEDEGSFWAGLYALGVIGGGWVLSAVWSDAP